jgi:hypothetical protein
MSTPTKRGTKRGRKRPRKLSEANEGDPALLTIDYGSEQAAYLEWERLWKSILGRHRAKLRRRKRAPALGESPYAPFLGNLGALSRSRRHRAPAALRQEQEKEPLA